MTEERRQMTLLVAGRNPDAFPYLYQIHRMPDCDRILRHLFENRISGQRFVEWVELDYQGSIDRACMELVKKLGPDPLRARPRIGREDVIF